MSVPESGQSARLAELEKHMKLTVKLLRTRLREIQSGTYQGAENRNKEMELEELFREARRVREDLYQLKLLVVNLMETKKANEQT